MGWDVQLIGAFRCAKHPVTRFLEIAMCFENSSNFDNLFSLRIDDKDVGIAHFFEPDKGLSIEEIRLILEPYLNKDCILEGWWSARERYFFSDGMSGELKCKGYRVALQLPDKRNNCGANCVELSLVYEIGSSNLFSLDTLKEPAQLNFEAVLQEIYTLSTLELDKMHGLNIDSEQDPKKCFLVYHREPSSFAVDLGDKIGDLEISHSLIQKDIEKIAQASEDTTCEILNTGIIIFSKRLINGDLRSFYSNLEKYLRTLS
jgi:hypothetical protein